MPLVHAPRPDPDDTHSEAHSAPAGPALRPGLSTDSSYVSIDSSELSERVYDPGGVPTLDLAHEVGIIRPVCFPIPSASRDCHSCVPGYKLA